ncbi:MAG: DMT family transporter [Clostridiales bacterium]|jgi:drug/metabolite transporter (DMT)-like permease|nr:DMT family transporter [Clostridiales bacterium]
MSRRNAELLLMLAIALRATSLLFSKIGLAGMQPYTLLGMRFLMAFAILVCIFHNKLKHIKKSTVLHSMIIGAAFTVMMSFELHALETTPSSVTSFLENTAIVLVPMILVPLQRQLPHKGTVISCLMAIIGVGALTLKGDGFSFTKGEILCLGAAVTYAAAIIFTGKFSKDDDTLQIGILQNGFIGLFAISMAFLFEHPELPKTAVNWGCLLALTLICSVLGFTIQPIAQRYVPTETAGLFCGLNPLIASILGMVFLHERLGINGFIGAAFILGSILVSHLLDAPAPAAEPTPVRRKVQPIHSYTRAADKPAA